MIIGLLSLVLALELLFHFVLAPRLVISHIQITADKGFALTDDQIVQVAGIGSGAYYFSVDPGVVKARLEAYPLIKSATVKKIFPSSVAITLSERLPFAVSLVDSPSGSIPIAFDEEGVVIQVGNSVASYDMPVVSGVAIPQIQLGMRLPPELVAFLGQLSRIKSSDAKLFSLISEFKFVKTAGSDFDVVLYPSAYKIKVRIGPTIDERQLKYIMMMLDVVSKQGMTDKLDELDFRTGQVVYKLKEGN